MRKSDISKFSFHLSKAISCRWNKETAVCAARCILVYAARIIKGCACAKKRADGKRSRERTGERFKADQYFIFERRCHDGNRYLKIEKHDTTSHFELKRAGGEREKRGRRTGAKKEEESDSKSGGLGGGRVPQRLVVTQV